MTARDWRAGLTMLALLFGTMWLAALLGTLLAPLSPATSKPTGEGATAWQVPEQPHVQRATRSRALTALRKDTRAFPPILQRIRDCESGGNYHAENPTSTASGAYQITDPTWNGYGGYHHAAHAPKQVQDQRALQLWLDRGTEPWTASERCWS